MRKLALLLPAVLLLATSVPAQVDTVYPPAPIEPYFELVAYKLSPEQETMYSATDAKLTEFWSIWDSGGRVLDQIEINCTYNGNYLGYEYSTEGFTDEQDARMWVRAAWGQTGLYLYLKVRDNQFVDNAVRRYGADSVQHTEAEASWYNDAIDIYFDKYGTDMLNSTGDVLYVAKDYDRQTKNMLQIQYQFGRIGTVPRTFSYNVMRLDPATGVVRFYPDRDFTFERARTEAGGLIAEIVSGSENGLADTAQVQEWHFPWSQVGAGGGATPPSATQTSKKVAFVAGYNDADEGATNSDFIRWVRAADPFKRVSPLKGGPHVPTDGWGDIVLTHEEVPVITPLRNARRRGVDLAGVEYYTVAGRLVGSVRVGRTTASPSALSVTVPANTVLLERQITTTGETVSSKRITAGQR